MLTARVIDNMTDTAAADLLRAEGLAAQALAAAPVCYNLNTPKTRTRYVREFRRTGTASPTRRQDKNETKIYQVIKLSGVSRLILCLVTAHANCRHLAPQPPRSNPRNIAQMGWLNTPPAIR
jgi:hypothetical protein